jgi:hypothetical protein
METSTWQHSQLTNIHARGGILTHDPSRQAGADVRLRPRSHWDRHRMCVYIWKLQNRSRFYLHRSKAHHEVRKARTHKHTQQLATRRRRIIGCRIIEVLLWSRRSRSFIVIKKISKVYCNQEDLEVLLWSRRSRSFIVIKKTSKFYCDQEDLEVLLWSRRSRSFIVIKKISKFYCDQEDHTLKVCQRKIIRSWCQVGGVSRPAQQRGVFSRNWTKLL